MRVDVHYCISRFMIVRWRRLGLVAIFLLLSGCERLFPETSAAFSIVQLALVSKPFASQVPSSVIPSPAGQDASLYTLTFNDDFNNFDTGIWNDFRHYWNDQNPTRNYTAENGVLKIWPQKDASGKFFHRTINTEGKWSQTYGYFEVEAKLPKGKGVWPAIWLLGETQEIDIMESYPGSNYNETPWGDRYKYGDASMHPVAYEVTSWFWPKNSKGGSKVGNKIGSKKISTVDLSAGFHKYGLKWEPDRLTFYFDGREIYSQQVSMPGEMFFILDIWYETGSDAPDDTTPTGRSNSFEINYVRAWQFNQR